MLTATSQDRNDQISAFVHSSQTQLASRPSLSPRQKWYEIRNNLKVGDVVLVLRSDSPRAHWPLARILEVYKGKDGNIRSAKIQVSDKSYVRPIVKLCPLEL